MMSDQTLAAPLWQLFTVDLKKCSSVCACLTCLLQITHTVLLTIQYRFLFVSVQFEDLLTTLIAGMDVNLCDGLLNSIKSKVSTCFLKT